MKPPQPFPTVRLAGIWLTGLVVRRASGIITASAVVALAVALLASLGTFLSDSRASMTDRAVAAVPVDWQVEVQPGAVAKATVKAIARDPHIVDRAVVHVGTSAGLEHQGSGSTQTTGPGQVLGLSAAYRSLFPGELRFLAGSAPTGADEALLFQQTAANLGARPGDTVRIKRTGLHPATVRVSGIVDLPQADSLFQKVGAPVGAQPQAPPDNVVLVSPATWHHLFDRLARTHPDQVHTQIHARIAHDGLAHDPASAYADVTGQARNFEGRLAGAALVGDNLGAALDSARTDALYAEVLFLFLGTPGAVLAGILTSAVAGAHRARRRREQALLRIRGASLRHLTAIGTAEAMMIGLVGSGAGLTVAAVVGRWTFGPSSPTTGHVVAWSAVAAGVGFLIAAATIAVPARLDAQRLTVATARRTVGRGRRRPWWLRWWIDAWLLAVSALVFWSTTRTGYELVLAPEGVPAISVNYWAFAGPLLVWIGGALLSYRLTDLLLGRGRQHVTKVLRLFCGPLADVVAGTLQRQRSRVAFATTLVALTVGFAVSTAVFNTTYRHQAEVDAVLTNGADVTVSTSPGAAVGPGSKMAADIAHTPGVHHVEPLQHRFAYVGSDLQDLYGVNPATILQSGRLQDAYFDGGTARELVATLAARPDSVLVSAETVKDFQLRAGDLLRLRLQQGDSKRYVEVPFHYVGVVQEFPTAPRDSFLVANADYVAQATRSNAVGAFLVDAGGRNVVQVATRIRQHLGTTATVTDIVSSRRIIGSSLTAVDLGGLTRLELLFALALAVAATGLSLWLSLSEQRRTYAIAAALGARTRDIGGFVVSEAATVALAGITFGGVLATALSMMLVKVLRGVFDPPPAHPSVPTVYLVVVVALALISSGMAAAVTVRAVRSFDVRLLQQT